MNASPRRPDWPRRRVAGAGRRAAALAALLLVGCGSGNTVSPTPTMRYEDLAARLEALLDPS